MSIYQRGTNSGEYAYVKSATPYPSFGKTYDYDFSALVYPKFIKVVCEGEPTFGEVVSEGEVTELNFQTKVVEVAQNGTIEVTPDHGFAAMNAVEVKVNVSQSEGGASGGEHLRYFDISKVQEKAVCIEYLMPSIAKIQGMILAASLAQFIGWDGVSAVAVDIVAPLYLDGQWIIMGEQLNANAPFYEALGIVEITKEEFYSI